MTPGLFFCLLPTALRLLSSHDFFHSRRRFIRELNAAGFGALLDLSGLGGPDNTTADLRPAKHPRQAKLRNRAAIFLRDWRQPLPLRQQLLVLHERQDKLILAIIPRAAVGRNVLARLVFSRQHALPQRRPDDLSDSRTMAQRHHVLLD